MDAVELPADPGGNDAGGEHKLLNQAEPDRQGPADRPRGRAPVRTPSGTGPQRTPGWQGLGSRGVPSAEQDLEFVGQQAHGGFSLAGGPPAQPTLGEPFVAQPHALAVEADQLQCAPSPVAK